MTAHRLWLLLVAVAMASLFAFVYWPVHATQQNISLYTCSNTCGPNEVCFLGKCFCLPGWSGAQCRVPLRHGKINGALCPTFSSLEHVQRTRPWDFPSDQCAVKFNDPRSCAIHCFWQEDAGIVQVGSGVWEDVSAAEEAHHRAADSGRNDVFSLPESQTRFGEFSHAFGGFKALPQDLGVFIEIGVGVYSQLINVMRNRPDLSISQVYFAEPNIFRYLSHLDCTYRDGTFLGRRVHLLSVPVEELPSTDYFDTLLVINVLEHTRNAFTYLTSIHKALKPGCLLIFSERYFEDPDEMSADVLGPATLLPVRARKAVLLWFLRLFEVIEVRDFQTPESEARNHMERGYHFIGRKLPPLAQNSQ